MSIEVISPAAEMLLTSSGPTTEAIQEQLLKMGRDTGRLSDLTIVRISDGWAPFEPRDGASVPERLGQRVESRLARTWSSRYLGYVLGKASVETHNIGRLNDDELADLMQRADVLVGGGGCTPLLNRGMDQHRTAIRWFIGEGLPYVGESAGSIVAGKTILPATLKPADTFPRDLGENGIQALGLLNVDIVTHAPGRKRGFAIPGPRSRIASIGLRLYETPRTVVDDFVGQRAAEADTGTVVLNDAQALRVSGGKTTLL